MKANKNENEIRFGGKVVEYLAGGIKIVQRKENLFYVTIGEDIKDQAPTLEEAISRAKNPPLYI